MNDVPETIATYLRLRGLPVRGKRRRYLGDDEDQPFSPGRDPLALGDALDQFTRESGWNGELAKEDLLLAWADVAGDDTARHTTSVALRDGTLTVQCDSTAWARQLSNMRVAILTKIVQEHPEAGVTSLRFVGPDVPSWKWGARTVPGRGPRDTYG